MASDKFLVAFFECLEILFINFGIGLEWGWAACAGKIYVICKVGLV